MIPFKQSLIHHLHVCVDKPTKCEGNAVKDLKLENLLLKGRVESLEKNVTDQRHPATSYCRTDQLRALPRVVSMY